MDGQFPGGQKHNLLKNLKYDTKKLIKKLLYKKKNEISLKKVRNCRFQIVPFLILVFFSVTGYLNQSID